MDIRDVRRFSISVVILAALTVVWLFFLWMHDSGRFQWAWPRVALTDLGLQGWLWIGILAILALAAAASLVVFGVPQAPPGFAKGALRQVQCQHCKAVFRIHDTGHRPITHVCPSCQYLGVYDGTAPPVGKPPKPMPPEKIIQLSLTCRNCKHRFKIIDTGLRPLRVECPECTATGHIEGSRPRMDEATPVEGQNPSES